MWLFVGWTIWGWLGSRDSTGVGGIGALAMVDVKEVRRGREGEGGPGQHACTSPYIEGYRGIFGGKNAFLP
jgi:hypothetical protein